MVRATVANFIADTLLRKSNKSGWGPYKYIRKGEHFVGTEPSPLKYHVVSLIIVT